MTETESDTRKKLPGVLLELQKARDYFEGKENFLPPPLTRAAYSDRMAWILASMAHLAYDRYEDNRMARKLFIAKLQGGGACDIVVYRRKLEAIVQNRNKRFGH